MTTTSTTISAAEESSVLTNKTTVNIVSDEKEAEAAKQEAEAAAPVADVAINATADELLQFGTECSKLDDFEKTVDYFSSALTKKIKEEDMTEAEFNNPVLLPFYYNYGKALMSLWQSQNNPFGGAEAETNDEEYFEESVVEEADAVPAVPAAAPAPVADAEPEVAAAAAVKQNKNKTEADDESKEELAEEAEDADYVPEDVLSWEMLEFARVIAETHVKSLDEQLSAAAKAARAPIAADVRRYNLQLAEIYTSLAEHCAESNKFAESEVEYNKGIAQYQKCVDKSKNKYFCREQAFIHYMIAQNKEEFDGALTHCNTAIALVTNRILQLLIGCKKVDVDADEKSVANIVKLANSVLENATVTETAETKEIKELISILEELRVKIQDMNEASARQSQMPPAEETAAESGNFFGSMLAKICAENNISMGDVQDEIPGQESNSNSNSNNENVNTSNGDVVVNELVPKKRHSLKRKLGETEIPTDLPSTKKAKMINDNKTTTK